MSLLAGAGLSALALVGAATAADAKPTKRRHVAAASSSQAEEIKLLKQQVEMLTARLDAAEAAQQQTQVQAQAANDQAQAAISQAQAATAATSKVPEQVKSQMATWKPKGGWWDTTTFSGRMYFNISNISQKNGGIKPIGTTNGTTNGTGFNIKRFYLGVDHKFDDIFSGNLTMDIANVVGRTSSTNFNNLSAPSDAQLVGRGFYVKKAYLQAKLNPALIIRVGAADMPWVPYVENIYGLRHIENTLIDRVSFGTSADWGVHVLGDVKDGILSYQFSVVDGAGYRNVKVTKSVDFEGRVSTQYKGFFAGVGGYVGKLGNDVQGVPTYHTAKRFDALAGYKNKMFTIGGEYFYAKNYNNNGSNYITSATLSDKSEGYSVFANVNFAPKWSAFGRYDFVKPRKEQFDRVKDNYFNVGVQYSPAKIVDLALVYKRDKVDNGTIATSNGNIGLAGVSGTYDEFGLFGQFRF
ncbi:hypothetical protein [Flavisphingomonas formosensis]|uniref:hypothetical protein n=1 Tax=Flavisphingomonas formosensis TaxID=861534 RepID=UPI001E30C31A|nr:hypothetical protein [Sphingomonas formosensis]